MKKSIKLLIILLISIISSEVKADICDKADIERQKQIASNITITSEHILSVGEEESSSSYKIEILGMTEDIYIVDDLNNRYYYENTTDGILTTMTSSGKTNYEIRSSYCADYLLETKTIELKSFNFYSLQEDCQKEEYKDLEVCDEWYQENKYYEEFKNILEEYKKEENIDIKTILISSAGIILFISLIIFLIIRHKKRGVLE